MDDEAGFEHKAFIQVKRTKEGEERSGKIPKNCPFLRDSEKKKV